MTGYPERGQQPTYIVMDEWPFHITDMAALQFQLDATESGIFLVAAEPVRARPPTEDIIAMLHDHRLMVPKIQFDFPDSKPPRRGGQKNNRWKHG